MTFNGAVHSFSAASSKMNPQHFFASPNNRKELCAAIKRQLKWEVGHTSVGNEKSKSCVSHIQVARNEFLSDIQEYGSSHEGSNLDKVYMGNEQSCYNHLIEIRNSIGVYLPVYFFFPMLISIKQHALPIFVGSSVKLYTELKQINQQLEAEKNIDLGEISPFMEATDEDLEDYESSYEDVKDFWPCFDYLVLMALVKKSLQTKLPLFVF